MNRYQQFAVVLTAVMILSVFAPLGTVAADTDGDTDGLEELSVDVDDMIVTVESNESAVANATVEVAATDDNATYEGDGEYTTGEDGTVELPEPEETVDVTVVAYADGLEDTTEATLEADDEDEEAGLSITVDQNDSDVVVTVSDDEDGVENATVDVATVDENATYEDAGEYTTDENGTLVLEAPTGNDSVEVEFVATVGDETAETTATLEPVDEDDEGDEGEAQNFGQLLNEFKENELNASDDEPRGLQIASFVVENNPGNAPAHAGPPSHAGPPGEDSENAQGPPEHAGGPSDGDQGPPEHAGGPSDGDEEEEEEVDEEEEEEVDEEEEEEADDGDEEEEADDGDE